MMLLVAQSSALPSDSLCAIIYYALTACFRRHQGVSS